ncbi:MAG: hypothetical protein HKN82_09705 [Akkermansiaceae bacterium]|nr:hypothetical protein [Akkermansiaceae bacterium]NNM27890.1 hypothetical protein [Akkermansiaceae bacterium]
MTGAQSLPTGSAVSDHIPEFSALLEVGIANPAGETGHLTFPDNGDGKYAFTFENKWLTATGRALDPEWTGWVGTTVTGSTPDGVLRSLGQESGYETNPSWPTGLTGINDFAPDATPNDSGLFYDTIGRGLISAANGGSKGEATWTIRFNFTTLTNGYLPAGAILGFIDTGDEANGTTSESMIITAGLLGGAVQPWMSELDYSVGLGYRDQPAPVWRGGNLYDLGIETPRMATGGSEYVVMQTTENLESLEIQIDQGSGLGAMGFGIYAPLSMPEVSTFLMLLGAAGLFGCRRRR